jgi:ABC-type phosphate/phosphonate transport system substrate-binding protein
MPAEGRDPARTLQVRLVDTLLRQNSETQLHSIARSFKTLLADQAGIVGEVGLGGNAEKLATQLREGKDQVGVFHGFEFAWARQKNSDLRPLIIAVNQRPFDRAVLVVRKDEKAADHTALRGKVLAMSGMAPEHCRVFAERRCVVEGTAMDAWFARIVTPNSERCCLCELLQTNADAAIVDEAEWDAFRKDSTKLSAGLRVLKQSEKFPCAPIAYQQGGLDETTLRKLRDGLISAKKTDRGRRLLELCRITGFEAVPADYEQQLADILKAYPPPGK